jgi:hypothetical protein
MLVGFSNTPKTKPTTKTATARPQTFFSTGEGPIDEIGSAW